MAKTRSMTRNQNHDHDDNDVSSSSSKAFDNSGVGPWSDVNHDVLFIVMMQLGVVDFIAFSGVCKSWRSLALSNKKTFMSFKPPMKMSIEPCSNIQDSICCYLEGFEGRRFKTILPHSGGRKFVGLTCGYVILFGRKTRDFWLVNLITRHELHFPDCPLDIDVDEDIKAILVFSPSRSGWVFVVFRDSLSFYIVGKRRWNHVKFSDLNSFIVDLHVFKGKIYTLHIDCSLSELRLYPNQKRKWVLLKTKVLSNPDLFSSPWLVSSSENLYLMSHRKVLELDFGQMKWVSPEKTIEEYAFFVNNSSSDNYSGAFKLGSWVFSSTQDMGGNYFIEEGKRRKCMFFYRWMWYFPHDCLNDNLLDE